MAELLDLSCVTSFTLHVTNRLLPYGTEKQLGLHQVWTPVGFDSSAAREQKVPIC